MPHIPLTFDPTPLSLSLYPPPLVFRCWRAPDSRVHLTTIPPLTPPMYPTSDNSKWKQSSFLPDINGPVGDVEHRLVGPSWPASSSSLIGPHCPADLCLALCTKECSSFLQDNLFYTVIITSPHYHRLTCMQTSTSEY
ncbi:hypothetical protein C0Q70_17164 [Pomacea canaliculata]|uniref:Uncharacterized protein n=1 Tax=Pomacea canaliculata TaxID=400727 RepID=A0A2T7NRT6_POMCA|nr:hypothetical protein C0Q70_17164 [Pomacea canaliculata]